MKVRYSFGLLLMALGSCGPARQPKEPVKNANAPFPARSAPPALANRAPAAPARAGSEEAQPAKNDILAEPAGPIDMKGVEAAGQVVQHYGALIEQGRLAEAAKLWGDPDTAATFAEQLPSKVHMEIGELGETEGAAGSIYTTVPVVFSAGSFRKAARAILRRVNDVPGSTEAQRRWHIERIEWGAAP